MKDIQANNRLALRNGTYQNVIVVGTVTLYVRMKDFRVRILF